MDRARSDSLRNRYLDRHSRSAEQTADDPSNMTGEPLEVFNMLPVRSKREQKHGDFYGPPRDSDLRPHPGTEEAVRSGLNLGRDQTLISTRALPQNNLSVLFLCGPSRNRFCDELQEGNWLKPFVDKLFRGSRSTFSSAPARTLLTLPIRHDPSLHADG